MLRFVLPGIVWTLFVIVISVVPGSSLNLNELQFNGGDKVAHFIMYALMTLFWITALKRQNIYEEIRKHAYKISVGGSFILGLILEFVQEYIIFGRYFEIFDLVANAAGCVFGIVLFKLIYQGINK